MIIQSKTESSGCGEAEQKIKETGTDAGRLKLGFNCYKIICMIVISGSIQVFYDAGVTLTCKCTDCK